MPVALIFVFIYFETRRKIQTDRDLENDPSDPTLSTLVPPEILQFYRRHPTLCITISIVLLFLYKFVRWYFGIIDDDPYGG
jgi:hypothetical protein